MLVLESAFEGAVLDEELVQAQEAVEKAEAALWTIGLTKWLDLWFKVLGLHRNEPWDVLNRPLVTFSGTVDGYKLIARHAQAVHDRLKAGEPVAYDAIESHPGLKIAWRRSGWWWEQIWKDRQDLMRVIKPNVVGPLLKLPEPTVPALSFWPTHTPNGSQVVLDSIWNLPPAYQKGI